LINRIKKNQKNLTKKGGDSIIAVLEETSIGVGNPIILNQQLKILLITQKKLCLQLSRVSLQFLQGKTKKRRFVTSLFLRQ
jgi:hypothetical protein